MDRIRAWIAGVLFAVGSAAVPTAAQDVTVGAPYNVIHHGFYEHYGIHWGFQGRGMFFNSGGGALPPQFGGYDPNADARFGFGGPNYFFNFTAGQGSSRSMVSQTPMITMPNGGIGSIADSFTRPFVTGIVPVVGERQTPLHQKLERMRNGETPPPAPPKNEEPSSGSGGGAAASDSTANRGDVSVADIRRQQADEDAAKRAEVEGLIEQARGFEERGKPGVARIYYQQAAKRATGDLQRSLREKVQSLSIPAKADKSR